MEHMTELSIERRIVLRTTLERAWQAVGTVQGFEGWFNTKVEGEWSVGRFVTLRWPSGNANEILLISLESPVQMAYRWHPGDYAKIADFPESELTTVTMRLREIPEGVELHLTETGFENISDERKLKVLGLNTEGWDEELENIRRYVEA